MSQPRRRVPAQAISTKSLNEECPPKVLGSVSPTLGVAALYTACLTPLATHYLGLPDLTGLELLFVLLAWLAAIGREKRLATHDSLILGLAAISMLSAIVNGVSLVNPALHFALISCPFMALRYFAALDGAGKAKMHSAIRRIVWLQVGMLFLQFATKTGVDDMQGTFVGTQYGEHVASFIVLMAAGSMALRANSGLRGFLAILGSFALAYAADSKVAILASAAVFLAYLAIGARQRLASAVAGTTRLMAATVALVGVWLFYIGAFGNISVQQYVEQSLSSGGGKIAVTKALANPQSQFWQRESLVIGAGPGQTVSRSAQLSIPNRQGSAPALRLGVTPAEHFSSFSQLAAGNGYLGRSSVTAAPSSLLGVLGDLGLLGLAFFVSLWIRGFALAERMTGHRSLPAMSWAIYLVPGFLGEWLEFPAATIFLAAMATGLLERSAKQAKFEMAHT